MSEWWSYRLGDFLLFAPRTYYRLFELYNEGLWPLHVLAAGIGLAILALLLLRPGHAGRAVALLLAICWAWVAYAFLFSRYATINWAAAYFAVGFAVQAGLLLLAAASGRLAFSRPETATRTAGIFIFAFALLVQPVIGPLLGRDWSEIELFGLAPDPTVLATLGVLLAADKLRSELFAIPLLWCAISGLTLLAMEAPDALLMPLAGILVLVLASTRSRWRR
jgi:hypothetical protein